MLRTRNGLPRHCTWHKDRDGNRRVRFRRRAVSRYLTGIPWSEDFLRQYAAALEADQQQRAQVGASLRSLPGSFSALCASYYGSPEFLGLKPSTQRVRRNILERFRAEHGRRALKDLQTTHVRSIIGAKASTPEAANNLLKILRVILNFAVAERMIAGNPALVVKRYKKRGEGIHIWSEAERAQFEARHPIGSQSAARARIVAQHRAAPQRCRQDGPATHRRRLHCRAPGEDRRAVADSDRPAARRSAGGTAAHQHDVSDDGIRQAVRVGGLRQLVPRSLQRSRTPAMLRPWLAQARGDAAR